MNNNTILKQIKELTTINKNSRYYDITILANISALLFNTISDLNWLGFYIVENNNLVLGPFQGKVACTYISFGKGVCGTCLEKKEIIVVPNVHEFPGHIACDSNSNSEIVLPIVKDGKVKYVFDIDSPKYNRFDEDLVDLLKAIKLIIDNEIL